MIELTIEELILWMIGIPIVLVGLYVCLASLKKRRISRQKVRYVIRCVVCGHIFQDKTRERSPICPECGRLNDRGGSKRLG